MYTTLKAITYCGPVTVQNLVPPAEADPPPHHGFYWRSADLASQNNEENDSALFATTLNLILRRMTRCQK